MSFPPLVNPRFQQGLQQGARQEMQLLPRMLQSIEVLQLSLGELDTFLESAVLENEALQLDSAPSSEPRGELHPPRSGGGGEATDRHAAWLESQPEREPGLAEHLEEQLGMLDIDDELLAWVRVVIGCIDSQGYLSVSDEALHGVAAESGLREDPGALGRAIAIVQGLEPRGVGGRSVLEALLLQLHPGDADYPLLCRLIEEFLEDLARNKLPQVARGLGIELDHLHALRERLRELDPAPGRALSGSDSPPLRPDITVELKTVRGSQRTTFEVRMERSGQAPVVLDPEVRRLASDAGQAPGVRRYLRDKIDRARWILEAVEQRERTLLRVATWIFERQLEYLRQGPKSLVPLTMTEAAEALGLHVSTVSRAAAGKYAETPWGIVALRSLFPTAASGRSDVARGSVQDSLRSVIEAEDTQAPLSDDDIALALNDLGFRVARRTVAKHRRELGIPSSYQRRQY